MSLRHVTERPLLAVESASTTSGSSAGAGHPPQGMSGISVVVVTWNSRPELGSLFSSLDEHLPDAEVIVVDNASTDGSASLAEAHGVAKVVRLPENRGFGSASNVGVKAAECDIVALLNPDTVLVDDSLEELARFARASHAMVGPELLYPDLERQPSASPLPAGWETAVDAVFPGALMPRWLRWRCEPFRAATTVEVGWLTGACVVAPRDVLLSLGPFDEEIHLYAEDMDLGIRGHRMGVRSFYAPDLAHIVHLGGRSAARRFADQSPDMSIRNRRRVVRMHYGAIREWLDFGLQVVHHSLRWGAKRALRRDCSREQQWLTTASRVVRAR